MTDAQAIHISILDKEYKISCPIGEQAALLNSAKFLDDKMREIRDGGGTMGAERIAVITALNITNDLLSSGGIRDNKLGCELPPRLKSLETKISRVLEQARQLKI